MPDSYGQRHVAAQVRGIEVEQLAMILLTVIIGDELVEGVGGGVVVGGWWRRSWWSGVVDRWTVDRGWGGWFGGG